MLLCITSSVKAEFIRRKYQGREFSLRAASNQVPDRTSSRLSGSSSQWHSVEKAPAANVGAPLLDRNAVADLSLQLHSSVRARLAETSLRLIAQGADVNLLHEERGTSPLHVAVASQQPVQVELLLAHGADLLVRDPNGLTPIEYAANELASAASRAGSQVRSNANGEEAEDVEATSEEENALLTAREILERLLDSLFELTDRLSYFAFGKVPGTPAPFNFSLLYLLR